ncbi:hypothetical protein [Marinobacter changyiensis]|uniref:hypothetical protein n=1 Tax=Marinobacter changyiensis TaxID=2604091 RepID=UPI001263F6B4|nr:hypothetical protein [Marinobacter changyiensis]
MSVALTAHQISQALFETDPMNTCCKENHCFDEYDREAVGVKESLDKGQSLEQALIQEISEWFYNGEDFDTGKIDPIIKLLSERDS